MEVKAIEFALDMLEPGVARRRFRFVGWGLLALLWLWVRSVQLSPQATAARRDARLRHQREVRRRYGTRGVADPAPAPTAP